MPVLPGWARPSVYEEAGFAPWWVDSAVLGSHAAPARTCLLQQGVTRLPEPARLVDLGDHGVRANDLTSHWGVEEQPAWEMCPEPKL